MALLLLFLTTATPGQGTPDGVEKGPNIVRVPAPPTNTEPPSLGDQVRKAAHAEGLDPDLFYRLVQVESSLQPDAVSPAGAVGLAQLLPSTARWLDPNVSRADLFDPDTNLRLGARYLRMMLDRYGGNTRLALLAYNRGPNRVSRILQAGGNPANGYARRVLALAND